MRLHHGSRWAHVWGPLADYSEQVTLTTSSLMREHVIDYLALTEGPWEAAIAELNPLMDRWSAAQDSESPAVLAQWAREMEAIAQEMYELLESLDSHPAMGHPGVADMNFSGSLVWLVTGVLYSDYAGWAMGGPWPDDVEGILDFWVDAYVEDRCRVYEDWSLGPC